MKRLEQPTNIPYHHVLVLLFLIASVLMAAACTATDSKNNQPDGIPPAPEAAHTPTSAPLATPYAEFPASGICAEASIGDTAGVEIWPDMPMPRCLEVRPDQHLQVTNSTEGQVDIQLGNIEMILEPGEVILIEMPFGDYLAPGVHRLSTSIYRGPELVLLKE